ncbi:hypothetical protein HYW58_02780 [Candidatus Kaiserbacteria bacterium]|nr:hypothetical protein [Candidatus Kaiserbacteria bacterium]
MAGKRKSLSLPFSAPHKVAVAGSGQQQQRIEEGCFPPSRLNDSNWNSIHTPSKLEDFLHTIVHLTIDIGNLDCKLALG